MSTAALVSNWIAALRFARNDGFRYSPDSVIARSESAAAPRVGTLGDPWPTADLALSWIAALRSQ